LPESVSVAEKRFGFSIFRQSIEDSDKGSIVVSWLPEQIREFALQDEVDFTGSEGRVRPI